MNAKSGAKSFSVAPRKPVNEAAARLLEATIEAKGLAVAGQPTAVPVPADDAVAHGTQVQPKASEPHPEPTVDATTVAVQAQTAQPVTGPTADVVAQVTHPRPGGPTDESTLDAVAEAAPMRPAPPPSESAVQTVSEPLSSSRALVSHSTREIAPRLRDARSPMREVSSPRNRSAAARTRELPLTKVGTVANPRERKNDGVKTRSTSVHLPIDLAQRLAVYCAENPGMKHSELIAIALEAELDQRGAR